jgi:ATP/maltotriose-dependent transcriptional regulator MalT
MKSGTPAELLFETLESTQRFRFLIASRTRPLWATARRRFYGEILEFDQIALALDDRETAEVLDGRVDAKLLHREARGWPALVALAAMSDPRNSAQPTGASVTLHEFLADEIYSRASKEAQYSLLRLVLLPSMSRQSLQEAMGSETRIDDALATGVAYEDAGVVEVLPLARNFLLAKIAATPELAPLVASSIIFALAHERWHEAFDLISRFHRHEYLDTLVTNSYMALTEAGRVGTLATFGTYGATHGGLSQTLLDLINAELSYRDGSLERARSLGLAAATALPPEHRLKARGYLISGLATQLDWQLEESFEIFDEALATAKRSRDSNDACWGRCLTAVFLEDERLRDAVEALGSLTHPTAEDRLRLLMGRQSIGRLFDGLYDLDGDIAVAESLLPHIMDPKVRSAWGNASGYTLLLQSRYDESSYALTKALEDVERYDLAFGRPHIEWSLAAAKLGLRQFARADALLRRVERHAVEKNSTYLQLNTRALRARLMLSQGRINEAVAITAIDFSDAPRDAMYGEYVGTRALSLALARRHDDALALANDAAGFTRAVETQVIVAATRAVVALGTARAAFAAEDLISVASGLGTFDGLVCAIRASPRLLESLATSSQRTLISEVLCRSNDAALAFAAGLSPRRPRGRQGRLSRRELEVLDLLRQGLKTREIAAALYLSDSTVKVYVRNILAKLNAHTRAEAVARYADESAGS